MIEDLKVLQALYCSTLEKMLYSALNGINKIVFETVLYKN